MPLRQRSLSTVLAATVGGLAMLLLAAGFVAYDALRRATDRRAEVRTRSETLIRASHGLLRALVDEEVGLRGYLATGAPGFLAPYEKGRDDESQAWTVLSSATGGPLRSAIAPPLERLRDRVRAWHLEIVEPQLRARAIGPLPDLNGALLAGRERFDSIRAAQQALAEAVEERAAADLERENGRVARVNLFAFVGVVLVLAATGIVFWFVVVHTARPITHLAEMARGERAFSTMIESRVREVNELAYALHGLDAENHRRQDELRDAHRHALSLTEFGEHVQQISDRHELHSALVGALTERTAADRVQVLERNASHNRLEVVLPVMSPDEQQQHPILAEPMRCRAVRMLRPVAHDAGSAMACPCPLGVPATGSYACVPLLAAGELIGLVNLQSDERGHFDESRLETVQGHVGFAAGTLGTLRLIGAARERALRDGLTGVFNRAFLLEFMTKTLARARREKRGVAVLMIDVDHFKRINDAHGHQTGDRAIVAFARCLEACTRTGDAVVRYGGEEFVTLLPDTDLASAGIVAERIRAAVERVPLHGPGGDLGAILRCSIGIAVFPEHGETEQSLIAAADAALYRAKEGGRNRVMIAAAIPSTPS